MPTQWHCAQITTFKHHPCIHSQSHFEFLWFLWLCCQNHNTNWESRANLFLRCRQLLQDKTLATPNWLWVSLSLGLMSSNRNCMQFLCILTENAFPTPWIILFYTAAPPMLEQSAACSPSFLSFTLQRLFLSGSGKHLVVHSLLFLAQHCCFRNSWKTTYIGRAKKILC